MSDLISRKAAKERLEWYESEEYMHPGFIRTAHALRILDELPSAERTGRWSEAERPKAERFYCSECGGCAYQPWIGKRTERNNVCKYKFCPNCGAKMEADDETD